MASFTSGWRRFIAWASTWEQVCNRSFCSRDFQRCTDSRQPWYGSSWSDLGHGHKKPAPGNSQGPGLGKTISRFHPACMAHGGHARFVSAVTGGAGPVYCPRSGGSVGGSGRVLGPAVAAGKFSAYGFPSLGRGAGKVPVGACVLTRVLYACGGEMSRGGSHC